MLSVSCRGRSGRRVGVGALLPSLLLPLPLAVSLSHRFARPPDAARSHAPHQHARTVHTTSPGGRSIGVVGAGGSASSTTPPPAPCNLCIGRGARRWVSADTHSPETSQHRQTPLPPPPLHPPKRDSASGVDSSPSASADLAAEEESAQARAEARWRYRYWAADIDLRTLKPPRRHKPVHAQQQTEQGREVTKQSDKALEKHQPAPAPTAHQPADPPQLSKDAKKKKDESSKPTMLQRTTKVLRAGGRHALHAARNPEVLAEWSASAWASIRREAKHYWAGTKLLWADVRTAWTLLRKLAHHSDLTWRERRQLRRTAADLARVGPFLLLLIIPFMELAIPVLLKVFPGFLPSTFKSKEDREAAFERDMKLRLGLAELMQDTVAKIAKKQIGGAAAHSPEEGKDTGVVAPTTREAKQLLELLDEVRHGRRVSTSDMANLSKLFNEVFTLDQMSRKQLVRLSTFFGLMSYASDNILRYQLRKKIRSLRQDDLLLVHQLPTLTKSELRAACHERGIRSIGLTEDGYKRQLQSWLDLSLKHQVPDSLLLLSRPIGMLEQRPTDRAIRDALLNLDEQVLDEIVPEGEHARDNESRLALLKLENARIKDEERQQIREEEAKAKAEAEEERKLAAAKARAARQGEEEPSSVKEAQEGAATAAAASAPPSTSAAPTVDWMALTSQLLSLVHADMERAQAIKEKARELKERAEAAAAEEEADEEAATKTNKEAAATEESEAAAAAAPAATFTSKLLSSFLNSKVESLLRDIDRQLGAEQDEEAKDGAEADWQASGAESDSALLSWIESTLGARGVHVTPEQSQRLLRMLKAMCEHDGLPLTHATLARLTRLTQTQAKEDDKDTQTHEANKAQESSADDKTKEQRARGDAGASAAATQDK